MTKILFIAATAFSISASSAVAQRAISPLEIAKLTSVDVIGENLVQVHRKHKKNKHYSNKHFRKYHLSYPYFYRDPYYDLRYSKNRVHKKHKNENGLTTSEQKLEDFLAHKRLNQR